LPAHALADLAVMMSETGAIVAAPDALHCFVLGMGNAPD
jgi:hypothetical protein